MRHDESGQNWIVPHDLAPSPTERRDPELSDNDASGAPGHALKPERPRGGASYLLAYQSLLSGFNHKKGPYAMGFRKLFVQNSSGNLTDSLKGAVWREDMASWVPELMRRRIVESLLSLATLCENEGRKYLAQCATFDDLKLQRYGGCGLFLGADGSTADAAEAPLISPPGRMSVLHVEGAKFDRAVVVYNLDLLLGPHHVAELRQNSSLFRSGSLYFLGRQRSLDLQGRLWKLQGYLARNQATHEPFSDENTPRRTID